MIQNYNHTKDQIESRVAGNTMFTLISILDCPIGWIHGIPLAIER